MNGQKTFADRFNRPRVIIIINGKTIAYNLPRESFCKFIIDPKTAYFFKLDRSPRTEEQINANFNERAAFDVALLEILISFSNSIRKKNTFTRKLIRFTPPRL